MTEINLLPWREALRNAEQKEFLILFAVVLGSAIFVLVMGLSIVKTKVQRQQVLNATLQQNIAILEPKMVAMAAVKGELNNLSFKQSALEKLQLEHATTVHLLEQLVYAIPPGVYLTRFDKKGVELTFEGMAVSNAGISEFMQKIEEAEWISEVHLAEIKATDNKEASRGYCFRMTARYSSLRANAKQSRECSI